MYRLVLNNLTSAGLEWELCVLYTKPGNIWLYCSSGFYAIAISVYLHHWLCDFCEPSIYVLFGCSFVKEGAGGEGIP